MPKRQSKPPGLIDYRVLAHQHALSLEKQDYLRSLFKDIRDVRRPLTLIVGAGVSINAGLPDWAQLLQRIIENIPQQDEELKNLAKEFEGSPLRRAEFILQMVRKANVNREEHELIRDGLYPDKSLVQPGPLAESLARLVAARNAETRIVTTNFDCLLDEALETLLPGSSVPSVGLKDYHRWTKQRSINHLGVLHVHGAVRQAQKPVEPLILTESHYLKHGGEVREQIAKALSEPTNGQYPVGLFVGLSLTDPNLLGPLYETSSPNPSDPPPPTRYALTVADLSGEASKKEHSAMLAVESVRFLDDKLWLRPIVAKSYAQVDQTISDLALALLEPDHYSTSLRSHRLHYGTRLEAALRDCYGKLGCTRPPFVPSGKAASMITERLREALHHRTGPQRLLNGWTSAYGLKFDPPERFGLHLWLRRLDQHLKAPTYSLALIGSSAFESKDPWYIERNAEIVRQKDYPAVEAVFSGVKLAANMTPKRTTRVWRGSIAIPVVVRATGSGQMVGTQSVDRIVVGALTLTSTKCVAEPTEAESQLDETMEHEQGIIARLNAAELENLYASLEAAAVTVLA